MDAIALLKQDHKTVKSLLQNLVDAGDDAIEQRTALLERIQQELEMHTAIEEDIFYPAFKAAGEDAGDERLYYEALEEHRAAGELVLPDLLDTDPRGAEFAGRAKVLKELVEHHADEEESVMFKRAKALMDEDALDALGREMETRKQVLMAGGDPVE